MPGQFEVTALYDGSIDLDRKLLHNASETEIQYLLSRLFITGTQMEAAVHAHLTNTGSKLVLVEVGTAKLFSPARGNVRKNLKAPGYAPSQLDAIFITHLHGDHMGTLLYEQGKPVFTNTTVYFAKAESDFYLSPVIAAKAPGGMQLYFKMVNI